jgi:hypothetical protein
MCHNSPTAILLIIPGGAVAQAHSVAELSRALYWDLA